MSGPPSERANPRGWHATFEHYTPDGTVGRVVFAALSGTFALVALGGTATFFGAGLVGVLLGVLSLVVCLVAAAATPLVLWPVYQSLIGNAESPKAYARGEVRSPDRDRHEDAAAVLKRRYAAGEISHAEFERRLDAVLDDAADDRDRDRAAKRDRGRHRERD